VEMEVVMEGGKDGRDGRPWEQGGCHFVLCWLLLEKKEERKMKEKERKGGGYIMEVKNYYKYAIPKNELRLF